MKYKGKEYRLEECKPNVDPCSICDLKKECTCFDSEFPDCTKDGKNYTIKKC